MYYASKKALLISSKFKVNLEKQTIFSLIMLVLFIPSDME